MKQNIFLVLFIIWTSTSFSQSSDFTIEANYPILIDDNYYGKEFNGIVDIGAKYRFSKLKDLKVGAAINCGLLINSSNLNQDFSDFKITSYLIQPKIFTELDLANLHPFIGFGYSFLISNVSGTNSGIDVSNASNTKNGFSVNLGTYHYLTEKIFVQVQYDFVKFRTNEEVPDDNFITYMNILKIGLGLRL